MPLHAITYDVQFCTCDLVLAPKLHEHALRNCSDFCGFLEARCRRIAVGDLRAVLLSWSFTLSPLPCSCCSAASWKHAACSVPPKGALVTVGVVIAKVLWMRFIALFVTSEFARTRARFEEGNESMSPVMRMFMASQH